MAKVTAPLGSFDASGQIAKSLVFFNHLGRSVVRRYTIPHNPKTEAQGDNRLITGALGRAARVPNTKGDVIMALKNVIAQGQTWVSSFISFARSAFADAEALQTEASGHTESATFVSEAAKLGLTDVTVNYAGAVKTVTGGEQLYALAKYMDAINAQNPGIFGNASPFDTPLGSWGDTDVMAFVVAVQNAS